MDNYVTGATIRHLREGKGMTQEELASRIHVSAKAVSKWETGRGFPDISLLEPLAGALDISVIELLSGEDVRNRNRAFNMLRSVWYVCPACGNVLCATGEAVVSCCGIRLPPLEAEPADGDHPYRVEFIGDGIRVTLDHPMTKAHFISFLAAVSDQGVQIVKLYPEGGAEAEFRRSRVRALYACCNRHGLFRLELPRGRGEDATRKARRYALVDLRKRPGLSERAAAWFHEKWGVPEAAYRERISEYLSGATQYGWYLCLDGERIVGGLGIVDNDFHDRPDLAPNICAVYTEADCRGQGIAGRLLDLAVSDMRRKGVSPLYLVSDHVGFYERYGWEFLCMVREAGGDGQTRMYVHR